MLSGSSFSIVVKFFNQVGICYVRIHSVLVMIGAGVDVAKLVVMMMHAVRVIGVAMRLVH